MVLFVCPFISIFSVSLTHRGVEPSHWKGRTRMPYEFACWVSRRPSGTM